MKKEEIFRVRKLNEEGTDVIITVGNSLAVNQHFESEIQAQAYLDADNTNYEMVMAMVAEMININNNRIKEEEK